jgi:hypothetical protein
LVCGLSSAAIGDAEPESVFAIIGIARRYDGPIEKSGRALS